MVLKWGIKLFIMIDFQQVTKTYQMGGNTFQALHGINLQIDKGEMVAIVGPSGSGKTTTMHIMGLLDKPTTGHYELLGCSTEKLTSNELAALRNTTLGFIFQQFRLLPRMNALNNVCLPLMYRNMKKKAIQQKGMSILDQVGLLDHYDHKPSELSGGQQQRVAIARALVGEPKIIMADEPTGALDSKTSDRVMDLLRETAKGVTIVVITHDHEVARQCHRQIKIHDGKIID